MVLALAAGWGGELSKRRRPSQALLTLVLVGGGEPLRKESLASEGHQRLKHRINGHRWRGGLLLKQPVVCSNHTGGVSRTTELQHGDGVIRPDVVRLTLTATSLVRWDEEDPPGTPPLARLF